MEIKIKAYQKIGFFRLTAATKTAPKTDAKKRTRALGVLFGILFGTLLVFQGCSSVPRNQNQQSYLGPLSANSASGATEVYGPPTEAVQTSVYGPEPIAIKPVVLVLGPGLARGFAYIGVIRVLVSEKIPIGAVLGTEMGGLIGTLYAMSPSLNQFEWNLQRFNESAFLTQKGFFSGGKASVPADGEKFEDQLRSILGSQDLSSSRIPLLLALQSKDTGKPLVVDRGNAAAAIRGALGSVPTRSLSLNFPSGLFPPGVWKVQGSQIPVVSAAPTLPFLVDEARKLNLGPVIVVDVLAQSEPDSVRDILSQADLVIRPEMRDIGFLDFGKRTDIAYRGRKAALRHLAEIRKWIGLKTSDQAPENGSQSWK